MCIDVHILRGYSLHWLCTQNLYIYCSVGYESVIKSYICIEKFYTWIVNDEDL